MTTAATVLIANAQAGSEDRDQVEAARRVLATRGPVEVRETENPGELDEVIVQLDGRRLVVCGGDGSLHAAVTALRRAGRLEDLPIGLIPLGTGNDFARCVGLPLEAEEAAAALLAASPVTLDLLTTDDGILGVNALHTGIGVTAAERAAGLKPVLGDTAYPVGALAAGLTEGGWDLAVHLDGAPFAPQAPTLMVAVLNGTGVGGGARLAPEARPDDGALDVVVSTATGPAARAAFAAAVQAGSHADRDDVVVGRGHEVEITGEPITYNVDGELEDREFTRRLVQVQPAAWRLLLPGRG